MTGGILKGRDIGVPFLSRTSLEAPCTLSNVLVNKNKEKHGKSVYNALLVMGMIPGLSLSVSRRTWKNLKKHKKMLL